MTDLNQVIFSNINDQDPWSVQAYLSSGGYQTWKSILTDKTNKYSPEMIIDTVSKSGLRGRGGAGFPTCKKWSFMPESSQ